MDWRDKWIDPSTGVGKRVLAGGKPGVVVGCIEYETGTAPVIVRRELQVCLDVSGGASLTHFTVEDCKEVNGA